MNGPRYKPFDVGLLRAPILPAQCFQTLGRHFDSVSELLVTLMSEHGISEEFVTNAINAASPELFIAMQQGHSPKVVAAVRRYLVRMCTRATPFGHFAGVSIVRWASENIEPLRFDAAELRSEPNYEDVLDHLRIAEQSPTVLPTLDVCSAPTLRHMGQRFYVVSEDESGDNIRLLRRTTLLDKVFALTIHPTSVATLLGSLAHNHGFDAQRVLGIIKTLVSEGFLVTSLYSEFAREPRKVARNLSSLSPHASSANSGTVMKVALLNASGSMQQSVADMASQCAYVLLSISPPDHLSRAVRTYQQEFNERYGVDRVVPLADLMEESGGLGLPSERVSADTWSPQYVRVLANLWSRGVHSGNEVEISEAEIAELAGAHAYDRDWPSTVDINITKETIKAAGTSPGEFRLHVAAYPGCIGAGRYMARFAPWLGQDALRLFAQIGQIESRNAGGDIVELRYLPTKKRLANLIGEAMTPKRVLSDHPLDGDLCVRDIGVVFSQNKLRIVALPSGEEIRVVARHMVNQKFAPRMYRLLIEITNGYTRRLEPFNWGPLKHAAKLPRVVYKHMVLSPARWAIDPSSIMSPNDLEILKLTLGIPDLVTIGSGDSRLLFDLRREPHLNEAYRQIARRKELTWIEAAVDPEACTIVRSKYGEHNGEIVVSLHLKDFEDGVKRSSRYTDSPAARFAPGSEWLYLKLRVTATAEETFLTEGLSEILQTCGAISSPWHFIRYSYPFRHLRLRIKSDRPNDSSFVTAVLSKVEALISAGLVIDVEVSTYWPEVDRFGGKSHLESIMNFFLADSQAAVEALGLTEKGSHQRISIGVALGRTLLSFANWADEDQIKFLRDSGGKYTDVGSRTFRDHRQSFRQMLEGDADDSECAGVAKRFEQKCSLIFRDYKWCEALRDDPSIVGDLLHLQANRLFGIDRQAERLRLEMLYRTIDWIRKYRPL